MDKSVMHTLRDAPYVLVKCSVEQLRLDWRSWAVYRIFYDIFNV